MALHDRLAVLDVLRGIAILGTLGTNIWIFMYPGGLLGYLSTGWDSHRTRTGRRSSCSS
jgi:uncharacterized protein